MKNLIKPTFLACCLLLTTSAIAQTAIKDADANTMVQTEKFANENIIRMDLNGIERWVLKRSATGNTQIELPNTGENLFFGNFAGTLNTGTQNTFIGQGAGGANTAGNQNTFIGQGTGAVNTLGQENTFVGKVAGASNTTGTFNTFLGESAGIFNVSGNKNTFLGESAGFSNTTASENTYIGNSSGVSGTTGQFNAFLGAFSGNANTAGSNTFIGYSAGRVNTSGTNNTYLGKDAGRANTTANNNTFLGASAGFSNTGSVNTFVGQGSGRLNTSGTGNTFVGQSSGEDNTTGTSNTFIGQQAGRLNTTGNSNTYLGNSAGFSNTTGFSNTFIGKNSGFATSTGTKNTCLGDRAGEFNSTGGSNTFIGEIAGISNTTGTGNTYLGKSAGDSHATNSNCTFLGNGADALPNGVSNSTALGNGAIVNTSNKIRFGNTAVTVIEGQVAYTTSDGRFKSNVKQDAPGLDFILGLRPVTYHFDYTDFSNFLHEENVDQAVLHEKEQKREMGFIAQEVEQLCAKQNVQVSNLVHTPENGTDNYSLAYGQIVVPLVKAIQEQQAEIEELKAMIAQLLSAQNQSSAGSSPDMQLWPNPTEDVLNISLSGAGPGASLEFLSAKGDLIRTLSVMDGLQTVDIQELPAGVYFVKIHASGKESLVKKLVKTK